MAGRVVRGGEVRMLLVMVWRSKRCFRVVLVTIRDFVTSRRRRCYDLAGGAVSFAGHVGISSCFIGQCGLQVAFILHRNGQGALLAGCALKWWYRLLQSDAEAERPPAIVVD